MSLTRRQLLLGTAGLAAVGCTSTTQDPASAPGDDANPPADSSTTTSEPAEPEPLLVDAPDFDGPSPFALGVASGDPDASSVVLWTRLISSFDQTAPLATTDLAVAVDVALDEDFVELTSSIVSEAPLEHGHSVHAITESLTPDTWFYYRFRIGEHTSPTGRARTLPNPNAEPGSALRFGFSSCQHWETGLYSAHRHLAAQDLDLFVWLGDYMYESGPNDSGVVGPTGPRVHNSAEVSTLDGYRSRYSLYRSDPDLQAHHAARPWVVTWDDHEVDNNYASEVPEDDQDTEAFNLRRAAAYQAWWEHMPVRIPPPDGSDEFVIYRTIEWGNLAHLHMLDGRQFRADQPTDGETIEIAGLGNLGVRQLSEDARNPENSLLGSTQRAWLEEQVTSSDAVWNVLGNQVYMHGLNAFPGEVPSINTDTWDGYFGERQALLETIGGPDANLVILTGDFHASTTASIRSDPFDLAAPVMATEFMAPAISSLFPPQLRPLAPAVLALNPQVQHFDPDNGFMTCEVTAEAWTTQLHLLDDVASADSAIRTAMTFTVAAGQTEIVATE